MANGTLYPIDQTRKGGPVNKTKTYVFLGDIEPPQTVKQRQREQ